jgi:hypothetical protein
MSHSSSYPSCSLIIIRNKCLHLLFTCIPSRTGVSSSYLQIIPNLRLHQLVTCKSSITSVPTYWQRHITSCYVTHRICVGTVKMKPSKQQRRQTDQSICLMQVKETAVHHTESIYPFRYSICAVYVTRRQDKQAPRRGVVGWSKDSVCNCCLLLSQQIWSEMLTASHFSSGESTEVDGKVASHLGFGSQWVNEYVC